MVLVSPQFAIFIVALCITISSKNIGPGAKADPPQIVNRNLFVMDPADETGDRTAAVRRLVKMWGTALARSRYFEADNKCVDVTDYPGWENIHLRKCEYTKFDTNGRQRDASVIAHEPSAEQIARWIVDACYTTGHTANHYMDRLFAHVICQSGGQFPVAGIVLEDLYGPPHHTKGVFENHCFRDGITVRVGANWVLADEGPLTSKKVEQCLNDMVTAVLKFARLQATTREDYKAIGGIEQVGKSPTGLTWKDVSAELYKAAIDKDRNELMLAWARTNLDHAAKRSDDPCVCQFKLTNRYCAP